ncbi:flagellar biosynthesis protein FlhB [Lysobacter xinjiangensis]|uniref:Flagellar biosynthetic protein FlhB n=1 Tax=Cognatilysobacter xinjiangensis TaxID=546892 RepID=A0ABQ3BPE4_9GAMM|nr:flagellar biosynthesis protein FlhB [Lysobacter xinjiangensis]GGZ52706.1 flagellar biosynthesis protein FlhB [Lysobacter xinjiangensis]
MSETDNEDRTEAPSEKRLREARERGDSPRSRELANVAVLGCATLALKVTGPHIGGASRDWMRNALQFEPGLIGQPDRLPAYAAKQLLSLMLPVTPLLAAALVGCLLAPAAMGSLRFSGQALKTDLTRLSPMAGIKRMYGKESLVEFARSVLRLLLIGGIAALVIKGSLPRLMDLPSQSLEGAVSNGVDMVLGVFLAVVVSMGLLAALDVPYQRFAWGARLKMTKQELRDEAKESDGNPEVKARMRHAAREMANRRMMDAVPTADVIVTNPTHYAVALKYEAGAMRAPKVVAKGVDEMALRIRELGSQNKVALVEAPPLARALYRQCKVDEEIPVKLYAAVAQVLTYIFQLKKWHPSRGPMPQLVQVDVGADGAPDLVGDNA